MNNYDWNAEDYAQHSTAQKRWANELIDSLNLQGDENVLDLGCGDGLIAAQLAATLPRGSVVGVDKSPAMIELARRRYPPDRHTNLNFEIMDAQALNFDARFDLVFSNAVLHWVKDHPAVLAGLQRSLKPGGKLLLRMGGQGDVAEIRATLDKIIASTQWSEYFQDFEFPYTFPRQLPPMAAGHRFCRPPRGVAAERCKPQRRHRPGRLDQNHLVTLQPTSAGIATRSVHRNRGRWLFATSPAGC